MEGEAPGALPCRAGAWAGEGRRAMTRTFTYEGAEKVV